MGRLIVLLFLTFLYHSECHEKRRVVESNYPIYQNPPLFKEIPVEASKSNPVVASLPSNYQLNYQFPNNEGTQYLQTSAQMPYSQYVLPYTNQYTNQPYQNLLLGLNQYQQLPAQINADFTKNVPISQPLNGLGPKVGEVHNIGFETQVYHPLHTDIHTPKQQLFQQQKQLVYQPNPVTYQPKQLPYQPKQLPQQLPQQRQLPVQKQLPQQRQLPVQKQSPPTPPKVYRNFQPIIPKNPAPIQENPAIIHSPAPVQEPAQQPEEKEESNEEQKEEQQEEDDKEEIDESGESENQEEENIQKESENFHPDRFFGNFKDDHEKFLQEDDHQPQEEEDREESQTKYTKKYNKPENYKKYFLEPFKHDTDFDSFRGFKDPKIEFKMYKYSKSSQNPERREYIDGKESMNVPVVQHNQKSYKESWVLSKTEMADE